MKRHKKYLTDAELEMLEEYRAKNYRRIPQNTKLCYFCIANNRSYKYRAKKDGLCGFCWRMLNGEFCKGNGLYECNNHPKEGEERCHLHKNIAALPEEA